MSFLSPWWLLLLVGLVVLAAAYVLAQRRRGRYAVRFAALPLLERVAGPGPGWRRHVPAVAFGVLVAGLVLGLARPTIELQVPRERATVLVALDSSTSMQATDVDPSRIAAATAAARTFVEDLPETFNVGLVTFSGTASVAVAPTLDREPVLDALRDPDLGGGTALGSAVDTSLGSIQAHDRTLTDTDGGPPPARIVLLSDGANTSGRPPALAADAASAAGVPVSTIAYGTPNGFAGGMRVPVDAEALGEIADRSGGQAYRAETGDQLREVYDDIGSSIGYRTETREITTWLLLTAVLAAAAAAATSLRWFARLP